MSLARCDKPRTKAGPGSRESQRHGSGVRGTAMGRGCCNERPAKERQPGRLWDGNKIVGGKEPPSLRKAKTFEIGPPKNGGDIFLKPLGEAAPSPGHPSCEQRFTYTEMAEVPFHQGTLLFAESTSSILRCQTWSKKSIKVMYERNNI